MKPYAESCEKNKDPILTVLRNVFADRQRVLEIASGTGQHAVYFAKALPHLDWQTSELPANHLGIQAWLDEACLPNVLPPLAIDVNQKNWPVEPVDAVFNANTVHIVSWPSVECMFVGLNEVVAAGGLVCLYGPFNYNGNFSSESNALFDVWLKSRDPESGVRDFEAINHLAMSQGFVLQQDFEMPSNNRILVWRKTEN